MEVQKWLVHGKPGKVTKLVSQQHGSYPLQVSLIDSVERVFSKKAKNAIQSVRKNLKIIQDMGIINIKVRISLGSKKISIFIADSSQISH